MCSLLVRMLSIVGLLLCAFPMRVRTMSLASGISLMTVRIAHLLACVFFMLLCIMRLIACTVLVVVRAVLPRVSCAGRSVVSWKSGTRWAWASLQGPPDSSRIGACLSTWHMKN
ncbi:unnamed protein product [Prorocentrum cordatum]|uniref:Secreted protein n=1 Tax=Prorocentrum cordatum TaxID=2364126 RepID=A0ABN9RN79_9DINO|nr:unnamed protein product [Polarella glacialis]